MNDFLRGRPCYYPVGFEFASPPEARLGEPASAGHQLQGFGRWLAAQFPFRGHQLLCFIG
jgi:hypothetical protein